MKRFALTIVLGAAMFAIMGCAKLNLDQGALAAGRGSSRNMGDASYQQAFATARQVLAQYYTIASANPNTGVIKCKPKATAPSRERLIGSSPARQVATMEISQKNGTVVAQVLVLQQRQGSSARQQMGYSTERHNYSGRPGEQTPADLGAATTSQQNQAWENEKPLHNIEAKILDDLFKALH